MVRHAIAPSLHEHARDMPWGMRELELTDPDGNRLRIGMPLSE